jgi:hypothetical protein
MTLRQVKNLGFLIPFSLIIACFTTCGLEEYYDLPQVSGDNVETEFNTRAVINLPPIPSEYLHYAKGYIIFYRIYLSDDNGGSSDNPGFSSTYIADYRYFEPLTDPTVTSSIPTINTFSGRRYYQLDYFINTNGGVVNIIFPRIPDNPTISIDNGTPVNLLRHIDVVPSIDRNHERFFRNTTGLNESLDSATGKNFDVASGQSGNAYVSMYIVAVGSNQTSFQPIFSKPTFISVFKLPNTF